MTDTIEGTFTEAPQTPEDAPSAPEMALVVTSAVVPAQPGQALVSEGNPQRMIEMATLLATALKDIVEKQHLFTVIQGKKHVQVEAWETIGRLDNVVAREASNPVRLPDGAYEAVVELVRLSDGMVIGRASALCGMPDDRPWNGRPEYNRRSMAVTRATSRAFRQQYSWIVALAGYEPTPADEMPANETAEAGVPPARAQRQVAAPTGGTAAPALPGGATSLTGVINKLPEGIRHSPSGEGEFDIGFKVANKQHWACLRGDMAERAGRLAWLGTDITLTVEGRYEERTWSDGPKMPKKKEVHDITRIVLGDEVMLPAGDEAPPDPAGEPQFLDVGYEMDNAVDIVSAERLFRKKSGDYVVHGFFSYDGGQGEFVTTHDDDPPPQPTDTVRLTGKFVPHQGRTILLGTIS